MNTKHTWGKRLAAAAGVVAVAVTGLTGTAFAGDETPTGATLPNGVVAKLSDVNDTGLHIFKHKSASLSGNHSTGLKDDAISDAATGDNAPMSGVEFTATKVLCGAAGTEAAVDLSTAAGWNTIANLKLENGALSTSLTQNNTVGAASCKTSSTKISAKTGSSGWANFSGVEKTVYLVSETDPGEYPVKVKTPNFLVTIPLAYEPTGGVAGGWIGDVYLYAKNVVLDQPAYKSLMTEPGTTPYVVKQNKGDASDTLETTSTNPVLTWRLSTPLPVRDGGYKAFYADDALQTGLTYAADQSDPVGVEVWRDGNKLTSAGTWTVAAKDATSCTINSGAMTCTKDATADTGTVRLVLGGGDFTKLKEGDEIRFTLKTKLDPTKLSNTSTVKNQFSYDVNNEGKPTTVSNGPDPDKCPDCGKNPTSYGTWINVKKVNSTNDQIVLPDAKFKVYVATAANADGATKTTVSDGTTTSEVWLKPYANGTEYTTAADGTFSLYVPLGSTDGATTTFYLEETAAPDGYILPKDGTQYKKFTFTNSTAEGSNLVVSANTFTNIKNVQSTTGNIPGGLPVTGAQGLVLLTLGGGALILVGIGIMMVIRRRQAEEA